MSSKIDDVVTRGDDEQFNTSLSNSSSDLQQNLNSSSNNNNGGPRLSFATDMWEGFDLLSKRTDIGINQCKELLDFFKKRVALEEKFSKSVSEHFSKFKLKDEADSCQRGFTCLSMLGDSESNIHKSFAQNLLTNLIHPFTAFVKEIENRRKKLVNDGQKLRNDYKDSLDAVRKLHQKYIFMCKEIENAKIELIHVLDREGEVEGPSFKIQTAEKKLARCEGAAIAAEEEYKIQIKETNDFINGYYQSKMIENLNEFEQFESMRMQFIKSNIKNYMGLMLEIPNSLEGELNNGSKQTDWIDPDLDMEMFIKANQSQKKLYQFQFEPYLDSKLVSLNNSQSHVPQSPSPPSAPRSLKDNIIGFFNKSTAALARSIDDASQIQLQQQQHSPPSSLFIYGSDLEELMDLQKKQYPNDEIPHILINFTSALKLNGAFEEEGIFRLSPSYTLVQQEKQKLDEGGSLSNIQDVHLIASLFKHWLRDLPNPLISSAIYDEIIEQPDNSWNIIQSGIPLLHQKVLLYVLRFLTEFMEPSLVVKSKMDSHGLSVIFAPVLIRSNLSNPQVALENAKKEIRVIESLLVDLFNKKYAQRQENEQQQQQPNQQLQQSRELQQPSRNHSSLSFATNTTDSTNKSDSDLVIVEGEDNTSANNSEHEDNDLKEFVQVSESTLVNSSSTSPLSTRSDDN